MSHSIYHGPVRRMKPYTYAGAGKLVSTVWKIPRSGALWSYRFNIFRMEPFGGRVSQIFTPEDVLELAKLSRALAEILLDDGCLPTDVTSDLRRLVKASACDCNERP